MTPMEHTVVPFMVLCWALVHCTLGSLVQDLSCFPPLLLVAPVCCFLIVLVLLHAKSWSPVSGFFVDPSPMSTINTTTIRLLNTYHRAQGSSCYSHRLPLTWSPWSVTPSWNLPGSNSKPKREEHKVSLNTCFSGRSSWCALTSRYSPYPPFLQPNPVFLYSHLL